jgi:two-component system, chemotaxis family, sensor kinase Cph1
LTGVARGSVHESSLAELAREKQLVETLYRVAQAVAERSDLHEIVQVVTDETTELTGAQFGAFFYNVVGRDGEAFSLYTISGVPASHFDKFPMPRNTDIFRPTYEGAGPVRIDDVLVDARYGHTPPYYGMPPGHLPVRSYLAVSVLNASGEVVGGLFFGHEEPGAFTEDDERMALGIATHAGLAIEKARLLQAERTARAEAEARATAAAALEFVGDGVVTVDDHGVVRLWNRAAEMISGLRAEAVLGRAIGEAVPGWERIALDVPIGEQDGTPTPATLPLDTLDGREVWLSVYGVAFSGGTVYAFRDVTGQRTLDSMRSDVIATVSHELRTPIAAVYGAAQTLRRRDVGAETSRALLDIIDGESVRLVSLVDEILMTSQIDSGKVVMSQSEVDPRAVAQAAVSSAVAAGQESSIRIEAAEGMAPVSADPEKLRQVLANLIENALKYGVNPTTPTILVRVGEVRDSVRFEVIDGGPGIPRHEQGRVFEKFYRLDPHMQQGVRGTGLGLYICRELVSRMQGRIGIDSGEGRGSTFWVELPRY